MHSSKKSHNHRFVQGISFGIVFDELFGGMPLVIDSKPKMEYSYDNVVVRARELDREIARTDETRDKIVTYTHEKASSIQFYTDVYRKGYSFPLSYGSIVIAESTHRTDKQREL